MIIFGRKSFLVLTKITDYNYLINSPDYLGFCVSSSVFRGGLGKVDLNVDVMIIVHRKSHLVLTKLQTTIIWSTLESQPICYCVSRELRLISFLLALNFFRYFLVSVHNKPMLWMIRGRKHGNVHGDGLNWSACLLALTPSGFDLAGLDLTHTTTYPKSFV